MIFKRILLFAFLFVTSVLKAQSGNMLVFNGTTNDVQVPHVFSGSSFGMEFWFRPAVSNTAMNLIVYSDNSGPISAYSHQVRISSTNRVQFMVYRQDLNNQATVTSTASVTAGQWHHVSVSWTDSEGGLLYLDGVFQGEFTGTPAQVGTAWKLGNRVFFGSATGGSFNAFNGNIDEVRFWSGSSNVYSNYAHAPMSSPFPFGVTDSWRFDTVTSGTTPNQISGRSAVSLNSGVTTATSTLPLFNAGAGLSSAPFQVSTAVQVDLVRRLPSAHYLQTANIDLGVSPFNSGTGFTPITFTGVYDGGGFTLSNLFINEPPGTTTGLFSSVEGASAIVRNVHLRSANVRGRQFVGTLAGRLASGAQIQRSSATGTVSGGFDTGGFVGGLVGTVVGSTSAVTNSYSTVAKNNTFSGGGLVGQNAGLIQNTYATGRVEGAATNTGGLVGSNLSTGQILTSYSVGEVVPSTGGGLVGANAGTVNNSFWDTQTSTRSSSAAGTGRTSAQMRNQSTFTGYNFTDTWNMVETGTYPYLRTNTQSPFPGQLASPQLSVSSSSMNFGTRNVFTSTDLVLTLTNTAAAGSMPLTVSSIQVTGTGYTVSPGSGSVASGNGTLPVTITFAPTTAGTFTGSVTVTHNATGSPTVISLTGTAIAAPVISSISPASAAIGASVTLSGQGFSATPANNVVWFGGVRGTVTAASATSLTVTVPLGAGFGPVSVTVDGKTGRSTGSFSTTFFTSDVLSSSSFPGYPIQRPYLEANESRSRGSSVIADFDGDGKLDLAVAAPSSDNTGGVDLYRNIHANGPLTTGSFASRIRITVANIGIFSGRILIADIDSDGKMDMVFANASGSTGILTVLRNTSTTGAFSFTQHDISTGFPTNAGMSTSLALGDVDGDGKPDIALSGYNNAQFFHELRTFRNTSTPGSISFESANGFAMSQPEDMVLGDVDGDGKADLVVTFSSSDPLISQARIYRSTSTAGSVSYATGLNLTLSTDSPNRITLGDLNRDGLPEVIVKLRNSALNVFPNQSTIGNLSFGTRQSYTSESEFGASLTVADLNGDGRPEVIETISGNSSAFISIYPNTGSGSTVQLGSRIQYINQNPSNFQVFGVNSLAVGDLDGDGKTDFITPSSSNIALFDNRMGTAGFQASSNPLDMGYAARNTTKQVTLTIQNPGTGSLTISSVTVSGTGFSITPTTATIPAGGSGNFTVSALFANAGTYNGSLTFNHNAPSVTTVVPVSVIAITSPLAAPTASAASSISPDGFTANWSAVATAASYQLDVSTQSNFSSYLSGYEARSVSGTSLAITGLTMSTTYYYRVRTVDLAGGISSNSATITSATTSQFAGGAGTIANPFQVATAAQLNNVRNFLSSHFVQTANISLSGYASGTGWVPIGTTSTAFTGTYNGQNFTISDLTLSGNLFYAGLFGYVSGASTVIEQVRLTSTAINGSSSQYVGALVGLAQYSATIRGSSVAGTIAVSSGQYIGGLVGSLDRDAILATSYSTATVSGGSNVGGLVGYSYSAIIRNVYSSASVTASGSYAGGVAGAVSSGTFENSYSIATVTGSLRGVLAGFMGPSSSGGLYFSNASGIAASGQGGAGGAQARTPDQLLVQTTFSGWDFTTVWQIESDGKASYPFLRGPVQSPAPGFTSTPRVPVVTVPLASATGVVLRPEFTWEAALAANRYDLQVSRSATFAVLDVNQSNLTATSFTSVSNLQRGLVYHWRVRSRSTVSNEQSAWSDVRTFTTEMLVSAVPGFAMRFDGTNDFATLPGVTDLSGNELTIEFWFKGSNPQSAVRHQAVPQHYIVSTWGAAPPYSPVLSNDGLTANTISSGFSNDGNWNHFAITWKRNTTNGFKTYMNGTLVGQRNSADAILPNINAALTLGSFNGTGEFMNGTLDEVRVWQVERSAAQIRETMYQVITAPQTGLRAFANFKEGTGTTSDDGAIVLNNFNGTASSGWVASTVPVGGTTASATSFTSGSTTLAGLGVNVTNAFDQASDLVVTRFDMAPAAAPTVSGLEFHTDSYWLTRVFGQPGTWSATLTFPIPTSFTLNGSLPNRRYRLYHRAAGSDGAWTQIAAEASANSATSVSFSGINQTGQFIVARSEAVSLASVDVSELVFGDVVVGMRKTLSVTFTNTGDLPITVSNIAVTGEAFSRSGAATASVAVGASITIPIVVAPTQAGALSGSLTITHSAQGSPSTISLSAVALPVHSGNAMSFTGQSGQYVLLADTEHPTIYTIELWFKPQVIENMGLFVRTDQGGPAGSHSHALRLNSDGRFEHYTFDGRARSTFSTTIAQVGRWYHLTAVYRANGDVALYVNGVEEGVNTSNYQAPWNGGTAYWVGATVGAHGMAKGEMDEVRLWFNTARTTAEVQSTMHQTLTTATGLRWNLRFDETTGNPSNRANALTATLMGAVPRVASTAPVQAPILGAPVTSLDFGIHTSAESPTVAQTLTWSNNGSQAMTVARSSTGLPEGGSWFTVTPSQVTVAPGQTATMDVRFAPTGNQRREESIRFDTNAEPMTVSVAAQGTGAILPSTWNTNPGTSLSLSNTSQISIPYDADLNPGTFTLELWVKPQSVSYAQTIVQSAFGSLGYRFGVHYDGRWIAWAGNLGGGVTLGGPNAIAGTWTHLALVIESGITTFYVNGRYAAHSFQTFLPNTSAPFTIGDGDLFAGQIDELRLWSVARTETQIRTWMHQSVTGTVAELLLHLPFDEGSGVAVFDRTSTEPRYALITGNATFSTEVAPAGSFINGSQDAWYFLANPTSGVTLAQFLEPLWTQGATGSDAPGAPGPNVFTLNETLGTYQAVTNLNVPAVPGKGYLVRVFKNDVYQVEGSFPKRLSVPRVEAPATVELPVSYTPTHAFAGFSLVGNPYPYTVDLSVNDWEFTGVAPTVYVYDQAINNYRTWNRSTGNASNNGSALIAPNQGFLMMASAASPVARAPRAARSSFASMLLKSPEADPDKVRLDLTLSRGDRQEQMQVLLMDEARIAHVRDMTRQLEPLNSERFMIYAVDPTTGLKIETFERSRHATDLLELPVHAEISTEGENKLRLVISGELNPEWAVMLLDTRTGTRTDLRTTPEVAFSGATLAMKAAPNDTIVGVLSQTTSAESARFRLLVGPKSKLPTDVELPTEVTLAQNYPNPFNPSTVIGFTLDAERQTSLKVYDVLGREVAVLIDGPMAAGRHQVSIDASSLAGGVYVYRLQVDGKVLSRKMTLLK